MVKRYVSGTTLFPVLFLSHAVTVLAVCVRVAAASALAFHDATDTAVPDAVHHRVRFVTIGRPVLPASSMVACSFICRGVGIHGDTATERQRLHLLVGG